MFRTALTRAHQLSDELGNDEQPWNRADQWMENAAPADHLTQQEIGWLRDLANGVSVGRIAEDTGYSERMMFRLLRDLYTRLGTHHRTEALMLARQRGWI